MASHRKIDIQGPAGTIEVLLDSPDVPARGLVLIGHPQPLLGGSATHKVPQVLARALQEQGWLVARPNFRGVGGSQGVHDQGIGETEDMLCVVQALRGQQPALPLALVGFSFGAFVQSRVAAALAQAGAAAGRVVLAGMPAGEVEGGRHYEPAAPMPGTLIVHGERDERVPLASVLAWCGQHNQPVMVVPGADHFFTGKLPLLRNLVAAHLEGLPG